MSDYTTFRATRHLPQVVLATTVVAVVPVAAAWWLRASGLISSGWVCVLVAVALSLGASLVGSAYWKRRRGAGDLLFSELLLWGWLRRLRAERQLANKVELLGLGRADVRLPDDRGGLERTSQLLGQLAAALEAQDPYTDGHSRRVARHSVMVARRMRLSSEEVATVRTAAAVHDIGKLRVPADVLNKPGKLTSAEFETVKRHADEGAEIVACLGDPELTAIVRHHHERFDGTGYPSGLLGEQIPLGARIVAVADTFDAMTSARPYRLAASHKQAIDVILGASGTQLDPAVVRAFLHCYSGSRAIVFWTLLGVSPQRALAWLRGKSPATSNVSFGAMLSIVAAITAIGAAAMSTSIGVRAARYEPRGGQQPPSSLRAAATPTAPISTTRSAPHEARHSSGTRRSSRRSRSAPGSGGVSAASGIAIPNGSAGGGPGPSHGSGGAPGGQRRTPNRSSGGKPSSRSGGKPTGGSGGKPIAGSGGKPIGSTGGTPSGAGGATPGGGSSGSSGAGGSASATGGAGGGSGGSGGSPLVKDQCKNGGYAQFGFVNQGQCIAAVERRSG